MQVQSFNPVDHNRFKEISIKSLFCTPYALGWENLKHAGDKESTFCGRIFKVITGLLLLVPLLNTITYLILRQWSEKSPVEQFKEDLAQISAQSDTDVAQIQKNHRDTQFNDLIQNVIKSTPILSASFDASFPDEDIKLRMKTLQGTIELEKTSAEESRATLFELCDYLLGNAHLINDGALKRAYWNYIDNLRFFLRSLINPDSIDDGNWNKTLQLLNEAHAKFIDLTYKNDKDSDSIKKELENITQLIHAAYLNDQPFSDGSKKTMKKLFSELADWINISFITTWFQEPANIRLKYLQTFMPINKAAHEAFPDKTVKLKMENFVGELNLAQHSLEECQAKLLEHTGYLLHNAHLIKNHDIKTSYVDFLQGLQILLNSLIEKQSEKETDEKLTSLIKKHKAFVDLIHNDWPIKSKERGASIAETIEVDLLLAGTPNKETTYPEKEFLQAIAKWINESFIHTAAIAPF